MPDIEPWRLQPTRVLRNPALRNELAAFIVFDSSDSSTRTKTREVEENIAESM